jgi:hypothetical protein
MHRYAYTVENGVKHAVKNYPMKLLPGPLKHSFARLVFTNDEYLSGPFAEIAGYLYSPSQ